MLYHWAVELRDGSKKLPNGLDKLKRARQIIMRAIDSLPENSRREDPERYVRVKDSIDFYIEYEKENGENDEYRNLRRKITSFEYDSVLARATELGFDGYFQSLDSASKKFTPDF